MMLIIEARATAMEPQPMLGEYGAHLVNGERVDLVARAEMSGPVALNDRQQAGHLGEHGLVGHRMRTVSGEALALMRASGKRREVASMLNIESVKDGFN